LVGNAVRPYNSSMPKSITHRAAPVLLPEPRSIDLSSGLFSVKGARLIVLSGPQSAALLFTAQEAQRALSEYAGVTWHVHAGDAPAAEVGLHIVIEPDQALDDKHKQAYVLDTSGDALVIRAIAPAGAFYGVMTLVQLLRQYGKALPRARVEDYPDFARRGVMLDISRDKVPTMRTLFELVDLFAELKMNELQLYTEHTFTFRKHPKVWANASPMTGEELLQLDAYCRARHIDLVPNLNCFGHMRRWLVLPEYRELAEAPDGCDTRWGRFEQPFTLNPGDPRSLELVRDMFDDHLPHFSSALFNVGCDETVDLGEGASKSDVQARGAGRVYLDFLLKIHAEVIKRGKRMQFWGDIIMEHPELVSELPKDVIALEWGYEFDHPFADHAAKFAESGIPFYVCPGTASWNSIGGRTQNMIGNIQNAAENGLRHGAIGLLNTDWGDAGHLQPLPSSYLGYAYGAAAAWCVSANRDIDLGRATSVHVFRDASGAAGKFAYDLGNVYLHFPRTFNCTAYGRMVVTPDAELPNELRGLDPAITQAAQAEIAALSKQVRGLSMKRHDAALIKREFAHALSLMRYGTQRVARINAGKKSGADEKAALKVLIAEHDAVWLARNRPGGMKDSADNLRFKSDGC
jgi:hexosaminidase